MADINERRHRLFALISLGVLAGIMSGLYGVGGGIIIVPILLMLGFDARLAAGTSVAAILPTAVAGATTYALAGHLDWVAAALLAVGVVAGAQVGSFVLSRVPRDAVFWGFIVFLGLVLVSLWISVPQRDGEIVFSPVVIGGLILTGFCAGVLSGVLGVGGGIIVVPVLMFFFGASDLVAKGSSLLMMVPGSISATVGNAIRRNVDLRSAAFLGVAACVASPVGVRIAHAISPEVSNVSFAVLVVLVAIQLIVKQLRAR